MTTRNYSSRSQQTTLTSAVTAGASTMVVQSGTALLGGVTIPAGTTFTLVIDPDTALEEIVDATAVSTNTFTITRAIDGSSAQAHSAGAVVRHMAIGRDYRESNAHIEASQNVHGITGFVVGTTSTQTLTNKTLTAPTISDPTITGTASAGAVLVFEGATADAHETTLTVVDPTQDNTITLPNTTGTVVIANAAQTLTNKTMGDALNAGGFKITNLATPTLDSDAVRKDFADAQVAAAATSAASAASSATAAASSATAASSSATTAANSVATIAGFATASANSATAAATSATSAAASASSASTSASSALTSQTAAATSATSAAASATAATTSATSAAASATAAATSATSAAASATASANSATASATSATASASSATAAATSATSAAASATSAATSATSAAASATAAAASFDSFDDRYLGPKSSAPTTDNDGNPLTGGVLYYNTTSGVMFVYNGTTSAWEQVAVSTSGFATLAAANTFTTSPQQINGALSAVGLIIRANATAGDMQQWQSSAGTVISFISPTGNFRTTVAAVFGSASYGAMVNVTPLSTTTVGAVVRGATSQTANLTEWQDSSGNLLTSISSAGVLTLWANDGANAHRTIITANTSGIIVNTTRSAGTASTFVIQTDGSERFSVQAGAPARFTGTAAAAVGLIVRGAASQTANLQEWQDSAGTILGRIDSGGSLRIQTIGSTSAGQALLKPTDGSGGGFLLTTQAAGNIGLAIQGAASQTADLQQWVNSVGTVNARITASGSITANGGTDQMGIISSSTNGTSFRFESTSTNGRIWRMGGNFVVGNGEFSIYDTTASREVFRISNVGNILLNGFTASTVGLTVRAASSQTADLQQWQNSAGTVLVDINASGGLELNGKDIELMTIMQAL